MTKQQKPKKKSTQKKLTQAQRERIVELSSKGWKQKDIAKEMGCSIPNISYTLKRAKERKETEAKVEQTREREKVKRGDKPYNLDPIDFRIGKLLEIEADIQFAREEKVIHTLGSLHKLHLSLHEELRTFVEAQKENMGTNAEELTMQIVDAIQGLPPLLKKQVMDELQADPTNIVRFKSS